MIIKYFLVGGTAAVIDIIIFFLFAKLLGYNYLWVGAAGFTVATLVNYLLSIRYVFESRVRFDRHHELLFVYLVSAIGLTINQVVLYVCVDLIYVEKMLSKLIATGSVFFWNYNARKHFVFKKVS